ncbi:hypothetical protein DFJ73DRAFT_287717 [Zopfochytrium polystomum]|nr:hypothetical protein DFJ73DRAFT_287717 [Zopfochytrium polystomum]
MAEFLSSERHVLGDYEPLPDEIFALTTRDPTDTWNPLRYVRHLDIDYAESHEECLVAIMSALAAAGTRLEKLKIGWLTVSEDVLSALLPLVQDATTSLTLERIVVPHSLNDPFAQLFPRLLSLTIGDFFGVGLLGPKLVALNSKSLTTYAGPPRAIPAGSEIIPTLANHAALRHLSLQLSYNPSDEANFLELLRHRGAGLRSLTVGLYLRPGRDLLRQLLESVPNLVALDIHNFNPHPATSLCDITAIVAPPPIARLCVLGITPDTAAPLIALVKTTLELLLVPEPPRGPDHRQAVAALVAAGPLPALRRLDLRNDEMDPQAVGDLATACPRLRRLCMPVPSSAAAAAPTIAALHLLPHLESVELYPLSTATDPVAVLQASAALAAAHSRLRDVVLTWEGLEQGDDFPEEVRRAEEEAQAASGGRVRIPRRVRDWPASLHSAVQFDQALPFQVGTWPFDLFR